MSLLTDKDLLLHQFQLAYIRHVLPNHAPLLANASTATGGSPHNLISFAAPQDLASQSPYLALSKETDPDQYPELRTYAQGRKSPPIALQIARMGGSLAATNSQQVGADENDGDGGGGSSTAGAAASRRRRRTAGPGPLGYTQTIVGRTAGGDNITSGSLAPGGARNGIRALAAEDPAPSRSPTSFQRYQGAMDGPPPVVVHSPTKTPATAGDPALQQRIGGPSPLTIPLVRDSGPDFLRSPTTEAAAAVGPGVGVGLKLATPPTALEAEMAAAASPGPFVPSPPAGTTGDIQTSPVTRGTRTSSNGGVSHRISRDTLLTSSNYSSSFVGGTSGTFDNRQGGSAPGLTDSDVSTPYGTLSKSREGGGPGVAVAAAGLGASSVSTSSASLFLDGGSGMTGRRPNSVSSSGGGGISSPVPLAPIAVPARFEPAATTTPQLAPPPPPPPAPVPAPAAVAPVFQLPPGLRVRERRRVNIRGGIVPNLAVPPAATASNPPMAIPAVPRAAEASASPATAGPPLPPSSSSSAAGGPTNRDRGPAAEPQGQPTPSSSSVVNPVPVPLIRAMGSSASLAAVSPGAGAGAGAGGRRTPREQLFPPRSEYIAASLAARRPALEPSLQSGGDLVNPSGARKRSALSVMLGGGGGDGEQGSTGRGGSGLGQNANPFSRLYATCVSRASDAVRLTLYFPHAVRAGSSKKNKVEVGVKRDVTVEEVIGVGLWACWEDEEMREGVKLEVDEREAREGTETVKWNLRIVEDDGEVDEDFPALDRLRNLTAFSFHEFAIVRASEQQIDDNAAKQATITRRPSRILVNTPSGPSAVAPAPAGVAAPNMRGLAAGTSLAATCPAGSALAIPVNLVVRAPPSFRHADRVEVQVPSDMYMIDVLHHILQRLALPFESAHDWVLVVRLADGDVVVPPDRTVESLGEQHTLELVPRDEVGPSGLRRSRTAEGSANPADPLFDTTRQGQPGVPRQPIAQLAGLYEHFSVLRKVPMSLGGRHARVIAIDGDYLHFMPQDGTSGRTTSFHVSKVHSCKISRRSASSFKIVVNTKRYDFEADTPERAREIVDRILQVCESWRVEHNQPRMAFAQPVPMAGSAGGVRSGKLRR